MRRVTYTLFLLLMLTALPGLAYADCAAPVGPAGKKIYNADFKVLQYCDGTDWIAANKAGSGSGGCSGPAAPEGKMIYNTDHSVMQVCSGAQWMAMGKSGDEAIGVSTAGLVGHWKLDDGAGTTATDSAGSNNGTLTNGPTWTTGVDNGALDFDGVDTYVKIAANPTLNDLGPLTYTAWIKPNTHGENDIGLIVSKISAGNTNLKFQLNGSGSYIGTFQFTKKYDSGTNLNVRSVNNSITLAQWQHVAVTWDGTASNAGLKLYVDGAETAYQTQTDGVGNKVSDAAADYGVGGSSFNQQTFDGPIDDVRVYNRVLSAAEIQNLYNTTSPNAGLVGWWKLDDGAGTTATDSAGSNNGTLTNMDPATDWVTGPKNGALDFDDTNDFVSLADVGDNSANMTVTAWVNGRLFGTNSSITSVVAKENGPNNSWMLRVGDTGIDTDQPQWVVVQSNGNQRKLNANARLDTNTWYHLAAVYANTGRTAIYINGALDIENLAGADGTLKNSTVNVEIGRSNQTDARVWNGQIDDVRIYNRALSAGEIQRLYGCTAPAHIEGTILYNSAFSTMQYCNGVNWIGIGK